MEGAHSIPTAEQLARNARWIRALSRALLRDEAAAEDLVQDTWVTALSRPPSAARVRPWLRQVLHNFARQHHRGTARRAARELEARPPAAPEAPDLFVERLEAEQRLTRELAALEEPFRSALMLRYYEDLAPAAIAARLGIPGGTVRWQLSRGLELLRARLDRAHGGERRAWGLALLPLAGLREPAGVGAAAAGVVLPGVVLMNLLKLSAGLAAALLLALGLSLSGVLPDALSLARRERPLEVAFRPLQNTPEARPALAATTPELEAIERVALAREHDSEATPAVPSASATIDARFVDGGRPLAGARLVVLHGDGRSEAVSAGSDGLASCTFPLSEQRARVRLELSAFGRASEARTAVCEQGGTTHLGRIELVAGGAISGRIVDEHGAGLAGCRVTLGSLDARYPELEQERLQPARNGTPSATTDADGRFHLAGVAAGMTRLWGHAAGRLASYTPPLEVRPGQESIGVEIALAPVAPENRLHGIVLDPTGKPVPGAKLEYRHAVDGGSSVTAGESSADREGRFEFLLLADAVTKLRAHDPDERWSPASLADLANGAQEIVLQLREGRAIELVVRTAARTPVESFAVELRAVDGLSDFQELAEELGPEQAVEHAPRLGGLERAVHAEGRVNVALPDQPFLVRVLAPGHRAFLLGPLDPERVAASLECTLEPVPGLSGSVLLGDAPAPGVRVELRAEVPSDTAVLVHGCRQRIHPDLHDETHTDAEGRFVLTPRVSGTYFVRAVPATGALAEAGPLTIDGTLSGPPLELRLGRGGAIEGRVRREGGADPEGAIVGITRGDCGERTQRVGRDGRFRFEDVLPGPWLVELRGEEVFGPVRRVESNQGPAVKPFDLAANCTVVAGETTFVDVADTTAGTFTFEGWLEIDGRPAVGWTARLMPAGELDFNDSGWTGLDSEGRFELRVGAPGEVRLALRRQADEFGEQYLFEDLVLNGDDPPWRRKLHTGQLRLEGAGPWDGQELPTAVHYWKGPGRLFSLTVPVGAGDASTVDVPAGPAELRVPSNAQDPDTWKLLRPVDVPRGAELRVRLSAAELGGR